MMSTSFSVCFSLFLIVIVTAVAQQCDDYAGTPSGSFNISLSDGRIFQLFTPWQEFECEGYCTGPPRDLRPLVIDWHGCNAHVPVAAYQEQVSRIEQAASDFGWYAITPVGSKEELIAEYGWNTLGIKCGKFGVDDFKFADDIIEWASKNLCVDLDRVYSTGFSTGAFHSYSLACRKPSTFAGIAPIAGSLGRLHYSECESGDPVSVLSFHSKDDKTVPYDGNLEWESQESVTKMWEKRNGCVGNETSTVTFQSETTTCLRKECPGAAVEDCTLTGLDHCWVGGRSGGFQTPGSCVKQEGDVDATRHMFQTWEMEAREKGQGR
ncbi:hypothetical protein TrCOL_g1028 [Triparma columacea]|uniref:Feruloyl esterase n=1 Tax=Triparma columacea TaxID=722753 RepID=A0A9W7L440_9STRA|nr:hypothetical protein TrCOL_g1028 [Triparma columacea]